MVEDSPEREADRPREPPNAHRGDGKGKGGYEGKGKGKGRDGPRLRGSRPRRGSKKAIMCKYFKAGDCSKENCPFAHGEEELARIRQENESYEGEEGKGRNFRSRGYAYYDAPPQRRPERGGRPPRSRASERPPRRPSWKDEEIEASRSDADSCGPEGAQEVPLPRNSVSRSTLHQLSSLVPCRHAMKGCTHLTARDTLAFHLETCPFEKCKEQLMNGKIDPILRFFKKQIAERDKLIQELRAQCSQSFKEEEEKFGLEDEQVSLFKELIFKTTTAAKIASLFSEKYPSAEWSVFFHHVSESDLSYVYDGFLQWVYKGRRYVLVKLTKPEEEGLLL